MKLFGKNFIFRVKSTIFFCFFQDQMYICGYKTTVFTQNLYILVKFFGKNFIFSVKSTIVLVFRDQMYICMQNYSFYPKFVHFSEFFGKNFIFSVKSTIVLVFRYQMYIFGYKTTVLSKICTF